MSKSIGEWVGSHRRLVTSRTARVIAAAILALLLSSKGWGQAAVPIKPDGPTVMIASFENQSPVRALINYEVGTGNDPNRPKRSIRVDRYTEAPRSVLEDVFVNAGINVVERQRVDSMLQEGEFSNKSGMVDSNTAVRVGKLLGANVIVMGTITDVKTETKKFTGYGITTERVVASCSLRVRAIDITTGRVVASKQFVGQTSFDKSSFGRTDKSDVAYDVIKAALDKVTPDDDFVVAIKGGGKAAPAGGVPQASGMIELNFDPTPTNCDILVDGDYKGGSPLKVSLPAGKAAHIVIRKAGYQSWEATVTPSDTMHRVSPELGLTPPPAPAATQPAK